MNIEDDLFVLLHSIMKKMRVIANKELAQLGITHAEMRILMIIYLNHADGCSQEELISRLEVDRSNVGRALKKLEQLHYIERVTNATDRRAFRVFLTGKGEFIRDHLQDIRNNLHNTFMMAMTDQELNILLELLQKQTITSVKKTTGVLRILKKYSKASQKNGISLHR